MKSMMNKLMILACLVAGITFQANAQNAPPAENEVVATQDSKITAEINATFNSRATDAEGKPVVGVPDTITVKAMNVCNRISYTGTIKLLPTVLSSLVGRQLQVGQITYDISAALRNPKKPEQVLVVGGLTGSVPLDKSGAYLYDNGDLMYNIRSLGNASGFTSKFSGIANGKPPTNSSLLASVKNKAKEIKKTVKGKTVTIKLAESDTLAFQRLVMGAGPSSTFPKVSVDGEMVFDYKNSIWHFNGLTMKYEVKGVEKVDKISGDILWVKSANYDSTGESEYQMNVRFNEVPKTEGTEAVFANADDVSSFFEQNTSIEGITGTVKFKDTFRGETVVESGMKWDLQANGLTYIQCHNFAKLFGFVAVKPFTDE